MELAELVTRMTLRRLAGARTFERGVSYFDGGRVVELEAQAESVTAKVHGEQDYAVRLWSSGSSLGYTCSCPVGASGDFCKHAVAVGLAYLRESAAPRSPETEPVVGADDVRAYLNRLEREELVSMVLEQATLDQELWRRLLARAAKSSAKSIDRASYVRAIDSAVWVDHLVDYRAMHDYRDGIYAVIGSLRELLGQGYADDVVTLGEYFVAAVEAQLGHVDDSGGYMGGILHDLQDLHHAACLQARPEPEDLADRLFEWEMANTYDVFLGAMRRYADVLGEQGLARYRRLIEDEWDRVPALTAENKDSASSDSGRRYRITHLKLEMAREAGDVGSQVAVLGRDLAHAFDYLRIAQIYQDAGQSDQALAWAENGLNAFSEKPDHRLREFVASEYQRRGRRDDAMALIWRDFGESLSLGHYQNLQRHATLAGDWPRWREKALRLLRDDLAQRRQGRVRGWGWSPPDGSTLVQVFLWEGDVDHAWAEATALGCTSELWLELARQREVDHPADALPIYQKQIEELLGRKNNSAYAEAVELVRRMRPAFLRLDRGPDFSTYLEDLKARHRRLRNFSALLRDLEMEAS